MDPADDHFKPLLACNDPQNCLNKGGLLCSRIWERDLHLHRLFIFPPVARWSSRGGPPICKHCERRARWQIAEDEYRKATHPSRLQAMPDSSQPANTAPIRGVGLGTATALNMIDMIGVGPFITLPLIVSAMGGATGDAGMDLSARSSLFAMGLCGLSWAQPCRLRRILSLPTGNLRPEAFWGGWFHSSLSGSSPLARLFPSLLAPLGLPTSVVFISST